MEVQGIPLYSQVEIINLFRLQGEMKTSFRTSALEDQEQAKQEAAR